METIKDLKELATELQDSAIDWHRREVQTSSKVEASRYYAIRMNVTQAWVDVIQAIGILES